MTFAAKVTRRNSLSQTKCVLVADINECATNNGGCSINAICINTKGSRKCTCKPGYTGNGQDCAGKSLCVNCV